MRIIDWSSDVCSSDLQLQQAVGAPPVAEGGLEGVGRRRQCRLDQVAELDLAEGAARLLVGQDILQADPLGRQLAQVDRKSVVEGTRVSVRVDIGGRRIFKKKHKTNYYDQH